MNDLCSFNPHVQIHNPLLPNDNLTIFKKRENWVLAVCHHDSYLFNTPEEIIDCAEEDALLLAFQKTKCKFHLY